MSHTLFYPMSSAWRHLEHLSLWHLLASHRAIQLSSAKFVELGDHLLGYFEDEHELCLNSEAIELRSQGLHHLPLCVNWPLIHFAVVSTTLHSNNLHCFGPSSLETLASVNLIFQLQSYVAITSQLQVLWGHVEIYLSIGFHFQAGFHFHPRMW